MESHGSTLPRKEVVVDLSHDERPEEPEDVPQEYDGTQTFAFQALEVVPMFLWS